MAFSLFVAKKFIASRKNSKFVSLISVISVLGIAIGVATLIIALTILSGFEKVIAQKVIQFNSHIQINSFSDKQLPDPQIIRPIIEKKLQPYVEGISPFAQRLAIVKSRKKTDGITIKGITPAYDVSDMQKFIIKGNYNLDYSEKLPPVLIGNKLAERLLVDINDKLTIFTLKNNEMPSPENPPSIKQFQIAGIYESGMAEFDDLYAYVNLQNAQEVFGMQNTVNGYDIKLNSIEKVDSISTSLMNYLGYPYYVRSIFKIYQNIFTWIDLQKKLIPIGLTLIVIVAAFNIIGTLLMIVLERSNSIGILRSLGAKRKQILSLFILQGIYISTIGILIGNALAFVLSVLQLKFNLIRIPESVYFMSTTPIDIVPLNYLIVSLATFILCFLTSAIPSYIATKISPVSALRFN